MTTAPPGWYPNPDGDGGLRYWDGRGWTPHTHGTSSPVTVAEPTIHEPEPQSGATAEPPAGLVAAAVGFGLGAGAGFGVMSLLDVAGHPGGDVAALVLSLLMLWTGMVGAVVYASRRHGTGSLREDFGWRIARPDLGMGVLGAIIGRSTTVVVAIPLYAAFHDLLRNPSVGLPTHKLTAGLFAVYAVAACVGAPVIEELFFRGLIQTRLVWRWGAVPGVLVTSAVFGAAHLIGWQSAASLLAATAIASGGVVLGYLRNRTGRLGTSTVAHSIFNGMAVLLLGLGVGR